MSEIAEKPPVSKMALLYYAIGVTACIPSLEASMLVGVMGGGFFFVLFSFLPLVVFAIFATVISSFDKLHWRMTKDVEYRRAGRSKVAIFGYIFFALSLLVVVRYVIGFQADFKRGGDVHSVSYALTKQGGGIALTIGFLTMAYFAQKIREMTFVLANRADQSNA